MITNMTKFISSITEFDRTPLRWWIVVIKISENCTSKIIRWS